MTRHLRPTPSRAPTPFVWALLAGVLWSGCGKENATAPPAGNTGTILVSPSDPTVLFGDTLRFSATVSGVSGGVVWRLSQGHPSTVELGTITADGLYAAPDSGVGLVDYRVLVTAKSEVDTTITGTVLVHIPRIQVIAQPALLTSVPPGTVVPYQVEVQNALDPGFDLFVEGIPGGNAAVGFFEPSGPDAAVYRALETLPMLTAYSLLVRSTQFPTGASATPFLNVRRGYQLVGDASKQQMSAAWRPDGTSVAYAEGPPWILVQHLVGPESRIPITSIEEPTALYDGQISWSPNGDWLCFSETVGGRRVLGTVRVTGADRGVFDPDGVSEVLDGTFLPTAPADPESLLVVLRSGNAYKLRAYPLDLMPGEPGVPIYEPQSGVVLRQPDAIRFDGAIHVTLARTVAGINQVVGFAVTGDPLDFVEADPGPSAPASRPVWTPQFPTRRITYLSGANATVYRVTWGGTTPPIRLYAEFYPEQSFDLVQARPNDTVLSRLHPDGFHRVWLVEFPPPDYLPKPEEDEGLRAAGAWRAWTPSEWTSWRTSGWVPDARRAGR